MLQADVHTHTFFSHAADSPSAMLRAGREKGLKIHGFSEHSPRPAAYTYPGDYQEKLRPRFPLYLEEVSALALAEEPGFTILLGLEADFIPAEIAFSRDIVESAPFDYIIGGLHFQGTWGFDNHAGDWSGLSRTQRFACYARYYEDLAALCSSGMADIVAHPDLIKIFSLETFKAWLDLPASLNLVRDVLKEIKRYGLLMELSSAGLRKPCREPYPGPVIMSLAAEMGLRLCISSDAHSVEQMAYAFPELKAYAASFGFTESYVVEKRQARPLPFS